MVLIMASVVNYLTSRFTHSNNIAQAATTPLPDEILLQVFSHLDAEGLLTCGKVCKQWFNVASDDALWSSLFRNTKTPFATKQEFIAAYDGGCISIAQVLEKMFEFIKVVPLGQREVPKTFLCEFPFNPEYDFDFSLDNGDLPEKNPFFYHRKYVFLKALPHPQKETYEVSKKRSEIYQSWLLKSSFRQVDFPRHLIDPLSFFSLRSLAYRYSIIYSVPIESCIINAKLVQQIEQALVGRAHAVSALYTRNRAILWVPIITLALSKLESFFQPTS